MIVQSRIHVPNALLLKYELIDRTEHFKFYFFLLVYIDQFPTNNPLKECINCNDLESNVRNKLLVLQSEVT